MNHETLDNWYLKGAVLHPTPDFLRRHVAALSHADDAATLELHFSDDRTITFAHAQLSLSPWHDLRLFTHMTVGSSSEGFDKIRQFLYCTPVDLSVIPCALVKAAWGWRLFELYNACFLLAETSGLTIVPLVEKYIPLMQAIHVPGRFKHYLAGRIAVDAVQLREWICDGSNQKKLCDALSQGLVDLPLRDAMRFYSNLHVEDILPERDIFESPSKSKTFGLVWRVPLADLLASGQEYVETELSTPHVSASTEVTWNVHGATLVVGIQRIARSGEIDVVAAVIGLPCTCADQKHNTGWLLEPGGTPQGGRNLDWVLSHEIGFTIFDEKALREWRNVHKDCGILIKILVVVSDSDTGTDADADDEDTTVTEDESEKE